MTRYEQRCLVQDLTWDIANEICNNITMGLVPKEWEGHELRVLLADKFDAAAKMSLVRRSPRSSRAKGYRNTVLVNNL